MKDNLTTMLWAAALATLGFPVLLDAGLSSYDAAIDADHEGALPYVAISRETMEFDTTNGIEFDFGPVEESSTIEFIVSGDHTAAQDGFLAVGENATWNLRYEQWDDTAALGFTHLGVADYLFTPAEGFDDEDLESPAEPTHVTYRWIQDSTTMELYLNGELAGTNDEATEYQMPAGPGFLGAKDATGTEGMSGTIERVTVYNDAIDPAIIMFHAGAWLGNSDPGVVISSLQDFGELPFIGDPQELTIPIRNSGQENELTVEANIIGGENFTLISAPSTVPPGGSGEIKLLFDRKGAIGQFTGEMEVITNDPDEFDQVVTVRLRAALIDREGPIAHYRLDEPAGATVMPDATGFGRDGVYGDGIMLGQEPLAAGTAMALSGGSFASISGQHFGSLEEFTLSLWVRADSGADLQTLIAKGDNVSPTFAIIANEGALEWFVDAGPEFGTDEPVIMAATTHHVAVSYSEAEAVLYVDGQAVATQANPQAFDVVADNPFMIGAFNTALPFAGRIDDIQIYDRALSAEQVAGLHETPGSVVTGELSGRHPIAARWNFDGNLSDTAPGGVGDVLTPAGTAEYGLGVVGQAVRISPEGLQRLRAADSDDLDLATDWTLEAFVWPDGENSGEWDRFWTKWGDGGDEWQLTFRTSGAATVENGIDFLANGGEQVLGSDATAEVPLRTWSHVALVGDSTAGAITAWLNGMQVGSAPYVAIQPGDGAMNFGNFESPANAMQFSGLIDEAIIHAVARDEAYLMERAALIKLPKFYGIASITSSTEATDFYPVSNLIQGPDIGFASETPFRKLVGGPEGNWVTSDPGGVPSDYIEVAGAPVLVLDLGADVSLSEISVWGYASTNANGVSEFTLRFATAAEGPDGFGQSITYNPGFSPTNADDAARQSFLFEESVVARYVEFTAVDNFFMAPGDGSNGETPGGDRVGLGEIAFEIEPSMGGGGGSGGVPRDGLGWVAGSSEPLFEPTVVDFGPLSGDATYEFAFNAVKDGVSTAIAGNNTWALKLDQWNEQGVFGTTEFGVVDNLFEPAAGMNVDSVFDEDVHVVIVNDTAAGETRLYLNGELAGSWAGNFELAGQVSVMAAQMGAVDPMGDGSVMYGWATYNSALTDADIVLLSNSPFASDPGGGGEIPSITNVSRAADGSLSLTLPAGVTGNIEYSVDLQNWEVIANGATDVFTDADAGRNALPAGFYRAEQ